jgi:hypothetical protein
MENWKIQFTAKATLPGNADKPSYAEMVGFLFGTLGLKHEDVKSMYLSVTAKEIFFRCFNEHTVQKIVDEFDGAPFKFQNGTVVNVKMSHESECLKYVRVWGIPPDAPDGDVARFFAHYGEVKRVVRERYPRELQCPIETGVRGVHMDLRQDLPHFMYIRNYRIKVHYDGQKERCFGCGSTEHVRLNCPKKAITPASRVQHNMVNLNSFLGTSTPSPAAPTAPEVQVSPVPCIQDRPVTPELTYANVAAASNTMQAQPQTTPVPVKSSTTIVDVSENQLCSPTTEMLPPNTRQSRSRRETRATPSTRDRCSRSGSSSNSSAGRPKKKKNLVIETIAKVASRDSSARSVGDCNTETNLTSEEATTMDMSTAKGPLDVMTSDSGNFIG